MRQIKFRGKNIHTGEWLYGDYHRERKTHYITKPWQYRRIFAPIEFIVDEKTIGQFTGLRDAHGKEIYEGDILKGTTNKWRLENKPAPHDFVGYVRWEEQCDVGLGWVLTSMDSTGSSPLNHYVHCVAIDYSTGSIIGNIHDNPELLSEK